jgi:hypothetical protein
MRIPTLRTTKNAVIASKNIDRILRNSFIKSANFCTVKEIQLSELNFPPRDDFEQHCAWCLERSPWLIVVPDA